MDDFGTLRQGLEQRGCRLTQPRLRVVQQILDGRDAFTAEDLSARLPDIGRATVYRTLKLLIDMGALCKMTLEDGSPRYRLSHMAHHHHVICASCGCAIDFDRCTVDDLVQRLEQATGAQVVGHRIEVYVICADCRQKGAHQIDDPACCIEPAFVRV